MPVYYMATMQLRQRFRLFYPNYHLTNMRTFFEICQCGIGIIEREDPVNCGMNLVPRDDAVHGFEHFSRADENASENAIPREDRHRIDIGTSGQHTDYAHYPAWTRALD